MLRLGRAVLPNSWRGGWPPAAPSTPQPTSSTLGPADVTVVVPVRDRPAQLDRLLEPAAGRGSRLHRGRRRLRRRRRDRGDRRAPRCRFHRAGVERRTGRRAQRRVGRGTHHSHRVRRLRLRALRRVARAVARPLRRPPGGGGGAPDRRHRRLPSRSASKRPVRRSTVGRRKAPCGRGAAFPSCRVRPSWSAPTWRLGPDLFDRCAARRRGRGPGLATGRGRLGRALRPVQHGRPRGPRHPEGLPGPPRLLRDDGRAAEPAPWGGRGAAASLGLVAARLDPAAGPPARARADCAVGVHRGAGRPAARARARSRRRGDADRRPRHDALGAAGAGLVDASLGARLRRWDWPSAGPVRACGPGPRRPRAARMGADRAGPSTRCTLRRRPPRGRRRGLRHRGLGRLRPGADLGAAHPTDRLARPVWSSPALRARPAAPRPPATKDRCSDYPLAKRSCPA